MVVGRITEVRHQAFLFVMLFFFFLNHDLINMFVLFHIFAGATETMEGGDKLSAGLCPPVVCCQPAWRRAGEMLVLSPCRRWNHVKSLFFFMIKNIIVCVRGGDQQKMSLP